MPQKIMFLISAQLQSGKDLFGSTLAKAANATTIALASPVKEVAISMFGMPSRVAYGGEAERRAWKRYCLKRGDCPNPTHEACSDAREILQWIGTECGRLQVSQDVWIHRLFERAPLFAGRAVIVTDARFKNELGMTDALDKANAALELPFRFVKIRLRRPGHENSLGHASESEQLEIPDAFFDEVVINDGTKQDLESRARIIAKKYLAK